MCSENVILFVPNVIGYARILLMLLSFYFMPFNYVISTFCYIVSSLLDAIDGYTARYFNQQTKFGAMLDQLTDRCGTAGLCMALCHFYPRYMFLFQLSLTVDISCHWVFFCLSVLQKKGSHKSVDLSWNPILKHYYSSKLLLFLMCAGNEAFYVSLYVLYFTKGPSIANMGFFQIVCYISAPIACVKSFISLLHGYVACQNVIAIDKYKREKAS